MIALDALFVNQYVELEDNKGNMLVAQIKAIDSKFFRIGSIVVKHRISIPRLVKQEVYIYFAGASGDKFQFKTCVLSQARGTPVELELSIPEDVSIVTAQKREFFRVPANVNFELDVGISSHPRRSYITKDISGGGISFIKDGHLFEYESTGLNGLLFIETRDLTHKIPFKGRFVYQMLIEKGLQIALEFTDIRESHRDIIIKYCMKVQLQRRF
ncbi:PilZ domain-containing protein [Paenibacillus sp. OK060]|uniref:flagellar brake protein n=1 Tax=Paenibacillus sp. OK060 TaxID=1881034 RepID=UPI00088F7765|nr:PilZ domain-containing protein [Paenibacillus sp. OK060]SDM30418.1 PilZ domain-containing protein [Paenibacillus sp. OK060]